MFFTLFSTPKMMQQGSHATLILTYDPSSQYLFYLLSMKISQFCMFTFQTNNGFIFKVYDPFKATCFIQLP